MSVPTLTSSAAQRICAIATKQAKPALLRLAVDGGGCAGFQYRFALEDTPAADDSQSVCEGATLLIDPISLDLLGGAEVDYVESMGGSAFRVNNPQASSGCGCGASFSPL